MNRINCIGCLLLGLVTLSPIVTAAKNSAEITYVSSEAVYINVGSNAGLKTGDSLAVIRAGDTLTWLVITNIGSNSAAATSLDQFTGLKAGDIVSIETEAAEPVKTILPESPPATRSTRKPDRPRKERLQGSITLEQTRQFDQSGSNRDWSQSGIGLRLRMDNIRGSGIKFNLRHRTRLYHRSRPPRSDQSKDSWTHRLSELSFTYEGPGNHWGAGRVSAPQVRGMGYVDGAYFTKRLTSKLSVGLAGGTTPRYSDSGFDFDRKKAGLFVGYETGAYDSKRLAASVALSSEYRGSVVSRDFLYLQTNFSSSRRIYIFQSAELDVNRDWRFGAAGKRLELTNYFGSTRVALTRNLNIRLSYDNRTTIRYFEYRDIADSLFDDRSRKGLRGGFDWNVSSRISLSADGGIRMRSDVNGDSKNSSFSLRLKRFPASGQSVSIRLAWIDTDFLTAYRPFISYRFRMLKSWNVNLSGTGYLYETNGETDDNYTLTADASRYLGRRYYLSVQIRQYLDSYLQSTELRTELGISL
ncbi:MAG: hypothetical protein P1R58_01055 [bacterium]|nr:hypothetical protein [bacterium]